MPRHACIAILPQVVRRKDTRFRQGIEIGIPDRCPGPPECHVVAFDHLRDPGGCDIQAQDVEVRELLFDVLERRLCPFDPVRHRMEGTLQAIICGDCLLHLIPRLGDLAVEVFLLLKEWQI